MKAVVITGAGGPEVLEIQERAQPSPGPAEALIRVKASSLNRADLLQRTGRYPAPPGAPPDIPGLEFAGEIVELGSGVSRWTIRQRVFGITGGGAHAEYLVSHQDLLAAIPDNLPWAEAGAIPEVFITAYDALLQADTVGDDRVLIHAVGSGVGLAAVQLCRATGAIPYGTSRTQDKLDRARAYGLERGFLLKDADSLKGFAQISQAAIGNDGFNVVLDLTGGPYFSASLPALATRGRIVLIGAVAGASAEIDLRVVLSKRLRIIGTVLRARSLDEKADAIAHFAQNVVPWLSARKVKAVIDRELPMTQIREAHRLLESNETFGKVVLTWEA